MLFLVVNFKACIKNLWFCLLWKILLTFERCSSNVNLKSKVIETQYYCCEQVVENFFFFFFLPTKCNFLSIFINIWIETHIPLESPIADISKIMIKFSCRYFYIMGHRKQRCMSAISVMLYDKLLDKSLG